MNYDVDYFIRKFEAIPENEIGAVRLENKCAMWHCGVTNDSKKFVLTEEASALAALFRPLFSPDYKLGDAAVIYFVNDGTHYYKQSTPRARILAALRDVKKLGKE